MGVEIIAMTEAMGDMEIVEKALPILESVPEIESTLMDDTLVSEVPSGNTPENMPSSFESDSENTPVSQTVSESSPAIITVSEITSESETASESLPEITIVSKPTLESETTVESEREEKPNIEHVPAKENEVFGVTSPDDVYYTADDGFSNDSQLSTSYDVVESLKTIEKNLMSKLDQGWANHIATFERTIDTILSSIVNQLFGWGILSSMDDAVTRMKKLHEDVDVLSKHDLPHITGIVCKMKNTLQSLTHAINTDETRNTVLIANTVLDTMRTIDTNNTGTLVKGKQIDHDMIVSDIAALSKRIQQREKVRMLLREELQMLNEDIADIRETNTKLKEKFEDFLLENFDLKDENDQLCKWIGNRIAYKHDLEDECTALTRDIEGLEDEISDLEERKKKCTCKGVI